MCSYTAIACDVLLIIAMIVFLLKYHKTMQVMLAAFLQMNTKNTGIQSVQVDQIGRTYPPLFTLNIPKEEEIIDDLRKITIMEYIVQVIMIIVCIAIVLIVMYFCCMKCRHTHTVFKYCFPFLPISCIVHMSRRTNLFVQGPSAHNSVELDSFCCYFFCLYLTFGECCESVPKIVQDLMFLSA